MPTHNFRFATAALIALACALCISTYPVFGHTWDEPEHLAAGMQLLDRGLYTYDIQHPPLARLAMAAGPYLAGARSFGEKGPSGEQEGRDLLYRTNNYDLILTLARLGVMPFFVILMAATAWWARRWFGPAQSSLAVFFVATTPTLLGHAGVAALDVPGAGACLLALYLMVRWLEQPAWWLTVALGLAGGAAVATKLSAVPFLGLCLVALVLTRALVLRLHPERQREPARRYLGRGLAGVALAALALVVTYGARPVYLTDDNHRRSEALEYLVPSTSPYHDRAYEIAARVPVPVAVERLTLSIKELKKHNHDGHLGFLLGEVRRFGWWYFYLVALAVKTPLPFLVLGIAGLGLLAWRGLVRDDWEAAAPALCFLVILGFCSLYSNINIGVRHVLVLYPLLAVGAGYAAVRLWSAPRAMLARGTLALLLAWQATALWLPYPDYLAYFNGLAGRHPERVLIDSDLDWGQDMRRMERELRDRGVHQFSFVYRGTADLIREDLPPFTMLPPNLPTTGWVAVDLLAKLMWSPSGAGYAWLDQYAPVKRIGKTIDLYYIPPHGGTTARR